AMKVLRKLGLEERMRSGSFYPRSWNNRDWKSGDVKFDMIFGESAEEKFGAPYLLAHRGDLHAALASAVPDECVRLSHKLTGLDETADGVRLTFANGTTATADAVVGADGVHSIVRDILFGQSPVNFTGRIAYRTTYPASLLNGERIDDCTKWWARIATSSSITSSQIAARSTSSPASPSRNSGSNHGRRRATSATCARPMRASIRRSRRCSRPVPTCTNGRSSTAIRWSAGRTAR